MTDPGGTAAHVTTRSEQGRSVALFVATFLCVFAVYGFQWAGGNPFVDKEAGIAAGKFATALMAILLSHEMAHYWVARRHGFALSLPYFIPFPSAFGTFGAIIRLQSLPQTRSGLLEMGAAGPLAGFLVAVGAIALGLPETQEHVAPQIVWEDSILDALSAPVVAPSGVEGWLEGVLAWAGAAANADEIPLMILANPPIMDLLGEWVLGQAPSRYATLDPLATAGWVGCLLTAINLIPIGQLDGGHILNALRPRSASVVSKVFLGAALAAGVVWTGWAFWACLLLLMGAWVSLPVPEAPDLSLRARIIAAVTLVTFALSFMPIPIEIEAFSMDQIEWIEPDGRPIDEATEDALRKALEKRLAAEPAGR